MNRKKYVKKHDYWRVMLTELYPYEIPLVFSLEGWKRFCSISNSELKDISSRKKWYYIPFNYDIKKGSDEFRTLSLIHPLQCYDFSKFYENYGTYILYLCNKQSKVSLRYPTKITNAYYSPEEAHHYSEERVEIDEPESEIIEYVRFYTYRKFDIIHKFFESPEYQRLEKKYKYCFVCDVSKCFYSIYTHTISWAVKNKELAKSYPNTDSFDSKFDKLMQKANYNETHGIIVGPEISRIFAEIIFQKIDDNIISDLQKEKYFIERDYAMRRYIDDYYIYYNDQLVYDSIFKIIQKRLAEYKFSINESKSQKLNNPFITSNTIVKALLSNYITENLSGDEMGKLRFYNARNVITHIKAIVNTYNISYSSIANYLLGALDKIIDKYIKTSVGVKDTKVDNIYQTLEAAFSIYFFIFNMDIRVDTSYKLSRRILETIIELSKIESILYNFIQFITKELERCFDRLKNIGTSKIVSIECINYIYTLLAIHEFCDKRSKKIPVEYYLDKLFFDEGEKVSEEYFLEFNYFEIIAFILCYKNDLKKMDVLKKYLTGYFEKNNIERFAEAFYLFIDIQSCPYLCFDMCYKRKLFDKASKVASEANDGKPIFCGTDYVKFSSTLKTVNCSFTTWDITLENILTRLLTKKARFNYDR